MTAAAAAAVDVVKCLVLHTVVHLSQWTNNDNNNNSMREVRKK